ncbi:OmpH family outer membrane protein [Persicobacter psychrovividus]|uniref:OmpH family outer membrane protein n=1 Tax=Persicobacter psychrovividus TaxID=387638 RepID=UPI002FCE56CA
MFAFLSCSVAFISPSLAHAQVKVGYVDVDFVLQHHNGFGLIQAELELFKRQIAEQRAKKMQRYQDEIMELNHYRDTFSGEVVKSREESVEKMRKSLIDFDKKSQDDIVSKEQALFQPVYHKVDRYIREIAENEGFTHVFTAKVRGTIFILSGSEQYDLTKEVLARFK